jgi:hypothetical protein
MMRRLVIVASALAVLVTACGSTGATVTRDDPPPATAWAFDSHSFRLPIVIGAGDTARTDRPVVVPVDFGDALADGHALGRFDGDSLRVVEVDDAGAVIGDAVPFQFDPAPTDAEAGELVVDMAGETAADAVRRYHVYFDIVGRGIDPATVSGVLQTKEGVLDESNPSVRVATPAGTWFVREGSGGASSLVDDTGADWLAYSLAPEAAGEFRGMPNAVRGRGYFHPDFDRSPVESVDGGPLRTRIVAATRNGKWQVQWDIFRSYAVVTMVKPEFEYYLMFEGLPGGDVDPTSDRVIRSNGMDTALGESWTGDLPDEEWVALTDPAKGRAAFVAHQEDDDVVDSYRLMDLGMTVLGFGREDVNGHLEGPNTMIVGLVDETSFDAIAPVVHDAIRPPVVSVAAVEVAPR